MVHIDLPAHVKKACESRLKIIDALGQEWFDANKDLALEWIKTDCARKNIKMASSDFNYNQLLAFAGPANKEKARICVECEHLHLNRSCKAFGRCPQSRRDFYKALQSDKIKCPLRKWQNIVPASDE